ncbi:MAG: hypothetical protein ACK5D5_02235, partial [Bacteroidota bacterium]
SLTLTTSPVFEQATTLTGTGINGTQVQVYIDNYPVGSPVTVSGGVWTLSGIQPYEIYPNGVLSLTAISAGSCPSQAVTASTVLCVVPSGTLAVNPANVDFCTSTGTVTVTVNNSQAGVIYQLTLANGTTNTGSSVLGTGGTITLTSGALSANTTIKVKALKLPPTCITVQTDNVPVNFYTAPTLTLAVGTSTATVCSGTSANVTVANSQTGFTYQLRDNSNNSNIGSPVTGTGASINLPTGNLTSTTTFNVLASGVSPSTCSGQLTNTVTITVTALPTTSAAGTDQTGVAMCGVTTATLSANTPTVGTGAWSIVSGTGGTVTTPSSPTSTFTGTAGTTYTLRWTISNSPCTASTDDVIVTFQQNPTVSAAGTDQTGAVMCGVTTATLSANTPSVGTGAWSIVSGTGGTVTTPSSPTSTFTGTAGTTYTLRWTISNSPCTASTDDVIITFQQNPTTAAAGTDQTGAAMCGVTTATLSANTPSVGTGAWSIVSGTGGTVTTPSSPTSTFTGTAGTSYTLRWTISNSPCTAST